MSEKRNKGITGGSLAPRPHKRKGYRAAERRKDSAADRGGEIYSKELVTRMSSRNKTAREILS